MCVCRIRIISVLYLCVCVCVGDMWVCGLCVSLCVSIAGERYGGGSQWRRWCRDEPHHKREVHSTTAGQIQGLCDEYCTATNVAGCRVFYYWQASAVSKPA